MSSGDAIDTPPTFARAGIEAISVTRSVAGVGFGCTTTCLAFVASGAAARTIGEPAGNYE